MVRRARGGVETLPYLLRRPRSSEKIMSFVSGLALFVYGVYMGKEYYEETFGDGAKDDDNVKEDGEETGLVKGSDKVRL